MNKSIIGSLLFGFSLVSVAQIASLPQSFSVSWGSVTNATKYQVKSRVESGATTVDEIVSPLTKALITKDILAGQKLYVNVRSCDAIWCGDWSSDVVFTMPAKPAVPGSIVIQIVVTQ